MISGLESSQDWKQCLRTNSTYLDCPIGSMNTSDVSSMYVAMHNPSSLNLNSLYIAIPEDMNFNVSFYNLTD